MSILSVNTIIPFSNENIEITSGSLQGNLIGNVIGTASTGSYVNISNIDGFSEFSSSISERIFITSSISTQVVNQNTSSGSLSFWQGSQTEYDAISSSADPSTLYFVI